MISRRTFFTLCTVAALGLLILLGAAGSVLAAPLYQTGSPTPTPSGRLSPEEKANLSISDKVCLECHGKPGQSINLFNGDKLELFVDAEVFAGSVHGQNGYACVQCHRDVGNYPHPKVKFLDQRDAAIQLSYSCQYCHNAQFVKTQDSVHARGLEKGNKQAAVCADCHPPHSAHRLTDPKTHELTQQARVEIPGTCAKCHSAVYDKYKDSVHGSALIGEGNPDVPTCIDCHGVHNIPDPTTAIFRLQSPEMCAKCHTDPEIMGRYGLSTDVLTTYVADFHGTTVTLFEKESPDAETNKPVCFDCHGIHEIARVDDPNKGLHVRQNLLVRCQACHPDATDSFPEAWLSHYIPSPEKYPMVYYVNLFYKFFIPGVLGSMALLVVMDVSRMNLNRWRARRAAAPKAELPEPIESTAESETAPAEQKENDENGEVQHD